MKLAQAKYEPTKEDLAELKNLIGPEAFRALKERGAVLNIWRNSSPHNWWVEGKRGEYYWHSDEKSFRRPSLKLFNLINESGERVVEYFGADSGLPTHSKFLLKK